jgi:hypothetical protein
MKFKFTSKFIHEALKKRYCPQEWIYTKEFSMLTGWESTTGLGRFVDGVAFNMWPSKGHIIIAFEIKVSRSDFRNELKDPSKREFAVKTADEFYFVVPKGMVDPGEIPHECGLMEVSEDGEICVRSKPPKPEFRFVKKYPEVMPRGLAAAILRRMNPDSIDMRNRNDLIRQRYKNERLVSTIKSAKWQVKRVVDELRVV